MNTLTHAFKRGYRHFSGCLNMEDGDIVLASFPRSGNTWFRTLFANCLKVKSGQESTTTMIELIDYMPVLGYSNLGKTGPDFYRPRLIKTQTISPPKNPASLARARWSDEIRLSLLQCKSQIPNH